MKLLAEARMDNNFVEPYLTGKKRMPRTLPDYYSPGEESEAKHVAVSLRPAWKEHRSGRPPLRGGPSKQV